MVMKLNLMIGAALLAGVVVLVHEHRTTARLRAENVALQEQAEPLAALEAEHERLAGALARAGTRTLPEAQLHELLKLRSEVGALRQQTNELARLRIENDQLRSASSTKPDPNSPPLTPAYLPRESWVFAGYADPDAALVSCLAAWSRGDAKAVVDSFTPAHRASWGFRTDEEIAAQLARNLQALKGFSILERQSSLEDDVRLTVADPEGRQKIGFCFKRIGAEWKFDHEFKVNAPVILSPATSNHRN